MQDFLEKLLINKIPSGFALKPEGDRIEPAAVCVAGRASAGPWLSTWRPCRSAMPLGLNRRLGNRHCYCLVNGQKAEYVGNICMDVALIDVTDIPCQEGDQVEIFGEHLPVTVLSDVLETIPYEVLTGISNRVKRVYFQD